MRAGFPEAQGFGFLLIDMKHTLLLALFALFGTAVFAQVPTITGTTKMGFEENNSVWKADVNALATYLAAGGGTVTTVSVVTANGMAGTVANATTTPAITLTTSVTGMVKGNGTALSAATSGTDYSAGTSALATGILKSTTTTGTLSIAVAGDFPTLNQNTTGSAATLTTSRNIYGNAFNGSADLTQIIASTFGGTGNGFTKFSGPATSEKTFTLPNASATILTDNAAVTAAQGGTGQTTYAIGDLLQASASTTLSKLAAVATGNVLISGGVTTVSSWGKVGLTTHVSGTLPVANGGTNLTAVGGDVTLLGSNGSANIYYTPAITNISAAIGFSRATATLNLNIPDADASFRGTVSTGTQTMAGNKTWTGTHTNTGLITGNGGIVGVATASLAAINATGVQDGSYASITSNTTLTEASNTTIIGTLTADITISLPACNATRDGWEYGFLKTGTDAFAAIIDPNSTETFYDGATTKSLYSQGTGTRCKCNGTSNFWYLIGR